MLSYRHSYHAGNHADVLKHTVLALCIEYLKEKEKPFVYIDTHAGAGRYRLQSQHAEKTGEYLSGVDRIWQTPNKPTGIMPYLQVLQRYNNQPQLKCYPGSPLIAKQLLRLEDRLHLTELHSSDYPLLRHEFLKDKRATVLREDGYHQLKSRLPPKERRGIVLLDPSYELKTDYYACVDALREGHRRFSTGIFLLWYPVVSRSQTQRMVNTLVATGIKRIVQIELAVKPDNTQKGMTASGILVVNAPWQLMSTMESILPWLHAALVPEKIGGYTIKELVSES